MKTRIKRALSVFLALSMLAGCLAGCGTGGTGGTTAGSAGTTAGQDATPTKYPGKNTDKVMRIAGAHPSVVQFDGNPNSSNGASGMMGTFLFEGMFTFTRSTDGLRNRLAKEVTHNGNVTTVKLRDDVKYNDGTPFTSKDIWCCLMIDYAQRLNQYLDGFEGLKVVDDYTLEFTWREPMLIDEIRDIYMAQNAHAKMPYHVYGKFADKAAELLAKCGKATLAEPGAHTTVCRDAANEVFARYGFPRVGGLGHELGTYAHESGISCGSDGGKDELDNTLETGMTFTMEPAILTSFGRLCQEEVVTVTETGGRYLSTPQTEVWLVR